MYGMQRPKKNSQSELIEGKGTGTSDSIKKNVPEGSYIMPADSTTQIGARNLKNLGKPSTTEVNVSNGEYLAAPEQLQAIGGLVLDRMKNATHTPVDQPQLGFKTGQTKPELFFANGGSVPDDDTFGGIKKSAFTGNALGQPKDQTRATSPQNNNTSQQNSGFGAFAKNMIAPEHDDGSWNAIGGAVNTVTGLGKAALGTAGGLMGGVAEGARSLGSWAANGDNSNRGNIVGPSFDFAGDGLKQAQLGLRQTFGLTPNQEESVNLPSPTPKTVPATNNIANTAVPTDNKPITTTPSPVATSDVKPSINTSTQNQAKADMFDLNSGQTQATTTQSQKNPFAIQQKGNSFSYANPGAAAQARANGVGEGQGLGFNVRPANDPKGVANFMKNTREMGPTDQQIQNALAQREMSLGMQGYGGRPRLSDIRTSEQEAQLQTEIARVSAPIPGSRGLTASQRNQINDLQMGYSNRANDVYKTDANNAAGLQREAMSQAGATGRAELQEQGANNRFNSNLNLEAQKFNATNDLANRQFTEQQLNNMPARMKQAYELNLLKQYEAAQTPEERQSLTERLGMVRGQQSERGGSRVMAISGGETIDEKGNIIKNPDVLINNQTGQRIDSGVNQTQQMQPTQEMIEDLRKNPSLAKNFEVFFGQGSAAKYLNS
ncbi:hypothetical protein [Acinetobacter bereziniae]|uniref:hypothetical protein n=1 Tax=Acinetobacter bereziniae TaxID=106648 RepID=UPI003AF87030